MLLIDTEIKSFQATAFKAGEKDFITVNSEEIKG